MLKLLLAMLIFIIYNDHLITIYSYHLEITIFIYLTCNWVKAYYGSFGSSSYETPLDDQLNAKLFDYWHIPYSGIHKCLHLWSHNCYLNLISLLDLCLVVPRDLLAFLGPLFWKVSRVNLVTTLSVYSLYIILIIFIH